MIPHVPRCQSDEAPPLIPVVGETLGRSAVEDKKGPVGASDGQAFIVLSQNVPAQRLDVAESTLRPYPPQTLDDTGGEFFGRGKAIGLKPAEGGFVFPA